MRFQAGDESRILQPGAAFGGGWVAGTVAGSAVHICRRSCRISSFCLQLDVLGLEGPEDMSPCLDREGSVGIFVAGVGGVLSGG